MVKVLVPSFLTLPSLLVLKLKLRELKLDVLKLRELKLDVLKLRELKLLELKLDVLKLCMFKIILDLLKLKFLIELKLIFLTNVFICTTYIFIYIFF
jgi:hypothetical protein